MKKYIVIIVIFILLAICFLAGSSNSNNKKVVNNEIVKKEKINYMILVNKEHMILPDWSKKINLETIHTAQGDDVMVEKETLKAFNKLKKACEDEGVFIDIEDAYRLIEEQEEIVKKFTKKYGKEYVEKYVALPGYSEHHLGLAIDVYLIIDGKIVNDNDEMISHEELWQVVFSKLSDYGFILRYPKGKESVTGYSYEPWHFRFVGSKENAKKLESSGLTLDEYLN